MKIASRPTTMARTPSPSANAARMIAMPRIWPAASGLRPIAWAEKPPMKPTIPGPITPRRRVRRRSNPSREFSIAPAMSGVRSWDRWLKRSVSGRAGTGAPRRRWRRWPPRRRDPPHVLVALDREGDEDECQDREDQRLDGVEHDLQPEQRHEDEGDGQRGDHAEATLAAVDVAEESHRQRDRLDELEHEFDQADEQGDGPGAMPLRNSYSGEELAEVAADPEAPGTPGTRSRGSSPAPARS